MSKFTGRLMGMGNPLLDISATVGQDFLDKYGVQLDTAILAEDKHQPLYEELVKNYPVQYIAGGATQNSIRVAQWMLSSYDDDALNHQCAYMGCVGTDEYGQQLEQCATADGVLVHYMKVTTAPTGTCAALIKDGERGLVANLGAANCFQPSHLDTALAQEIIQAAQVYYIAGFFLTVSVESLVRVAQHAVDANKIFCLNLAAPFIIDFFHDALQQAMPYADFLFGNEGEAATLARKHGLPEDDLAAVALAVSTWPKHNTNRPRTVIFTQGSKSTLVACQGVVTEYPVEALAADKLVDTNGAGDAFVGGFLSQLVQGKPMEECIRAGHWAARFIIQQSGTTLSAKCDYASTTTATA